MGKCGGRCGEGLAVTVTYCPEGETGMIEGVWGRCGKVWGRCGESAHRCVDVQLRRYGSWVEAVTDKVHRNHVIDE